jgi:hypothetical protein
MKSPRRKHKPLNKNAASNSEVLNRCINILEKRVVNSDFIGKREKSEILTSLNEIKVSIKNGGNPKYSIRMLVAYCANFSLLSRVANKIWELIDNKVQLTGS